MIYFDHNATTPLLAAARDAWLAAAEQFPGNPSSPHRVGARADNALSDARAKLADFLGCDPLDIVWTSGATESNNAVFHHFAKTLPTRSRVWVSAIEHPCVLESAQHHFSERHRLIPVMHDGVVDLEWLQTNLAKQRPGLVAVMAANNETGVLQPWHEVLTLCREHKVPFFCDAAQWIGKLPALGLGQCDFVSGCAHKFGGPKGVGFLKVAGTGRFEPLLLGGPQEESRRAGTENVASVLSMMAALEAREIALASEHPSPVLRIPSPLAQRGEKDRQSTSPETPSPFVGRGDFRAERKEFAAGESPQGRRRLRRSPWDGVRGGELSRVRIRDEFTAGLLKSLPGSEIVGGNQPRLWNTVSALIPQADCQQRWVVKLDKLGFAVSTGSACASGKEKPSHVLTAMSYPASAAGRVLRFSSGWETTAKEWKSLLEALRKAHHAMPR